MANQDFTVTLSAKDLLSGKLKEVEAALSKLGASFKRVEAPVEAVSTSMTGTLREVTRLGRGMLILQGAILGMEGVSSPAMQKFTRVLSGVTIGFTVLRSATTLSTGAIGAIVAIVSVAGLAFSKLNAGVKESEEEMKKYTKSLEDSNRQISQHRRELRLLGRDERQADIESLRLQIKVQDEHIEALRKTGRELSDERKRLDEVENRRSNVTQLTEQNTKATEQNNQEIKNSEAILKRLERQFKDLDFEMKGGTEETRRFTRAQEDLIAEFKQLGNVPLRAVLGLKRGLVDAHTAATKFFSSIVLGSARGRTALKAFGQALKESVVNQLADIAVTGGIKFLTGLFTGGGAGILTTAPAVTGTSVGGAATVSFGGGAGAAFGGGAAAGAASVISGAQKPGQITSRQLAELQLFEQERIVARQSEMEGFETTVSNLKEALRESTAGIQIQAGTREALVRGDIPPEAAFVLEGRRRDIAGKVAALISQLGADIDQRTTEQSNIQAQLAEAEKVLFDERIKDIQAQIDAEALQNKIILEEEKKANDAELAVIEEVEKMATELLLPLIQQRFGGGTLTQEGMADIGRLLAGGITPEEARLFEPESVIEAARGAGINVNAPITVNATIANDMDINRIAEMLGTRLREMIQVAMPRTV